MGIYIDMEMPKEFGRCMVIFPDGRVTTEFGSQVIARAISVPPHGDLIDRDKVGLTGFEIVLCNGDYKEGMKMLLEKIESTPTIIPAEEGKT